MEWWKNTVIYHIYINSFKDGNGDGIGDFKGLASKLDYFQYLGVGTLLLSPVHPSPMKDNGYDISDFMGINPTYGTLEDFENFMKEVKKRELHVIMDLVVNHTSNEHPWFQKSVERVDPYTNYYIWVDPSKDGKPPNNWLSVFDNSAWEYSPKRKQFYLHQFLVEQPDLDWRYPTVRKEVEKILRFWLDKGVDGFRVDAICHFLEDELMRNEPITARPKCNPEEYEYLDHIYTKGLKENHALVKEWRAVLNEYEKKTGKAKIIITEAYEPIEDLMLYYGEDGKRLSDVPFNTELLNLNKNSSAQDLFNLIKSWLDVMPKGKVANWIMGNHDQRDRFASRIGPELLPGLHMVTTLLPGIVFCYYGDEFGMIERFIKEKDTKDSFALRTTIEKSRDPVRTPMQWDDSENAGFTKHTKPWLPVNENFKSLNIKKQKEDPLSNLEIFRKLLRLRNEPSIKDGVVEFPFIDGNIFTMIRCYPKTKSYLVVVNMGKSLAVVDLTSTSKYLPESGSIEITNNKYYFLDKSSILTDCVQDFSLQYRKAYSLCNTSILAKVSFGNIVLLPKEAMVISFMPNQIPTSS